MKCEVCNTENEGGKCSKCGFTMVVMLGDDSENIMQRAAANFRKNLLSGIKIRKEVYSYKESNDKDFIETTDNIQIFDGNTDDLLPEEIKWYDEKFARNGAGDDMTLTFFIDSYGKIKKKEISIKAPDIKSFWQLGIKYKGYLDYSLVFGNENEYSETESFCILD